MHVRQYHEEREGKLWKWTVYLKNKSKTIIFSTFPLGKNIKFQEFYLGKWNEEKSAKVKKEWQEKS